jgi:hypothetical protein
LNVFIAVAGCNASPLLRSKPQVAPFRQLDACTHFEDNTVFVEPRNHSPYGNPQIISLSKIVSRGVDPTNSALRQKNRAV